MLTQLESRCLTALRDYLNQHNHAPTLSELGQLVGIKSRGTVHRYVSALIDKGYLERSSKQGWRGITLSPSSEQSLNSLPLLGKIAAGKPIEAIANQTQINLQTMFLGPNRYVLEVEGDSMQDAAILDGDLVVIESQTQANDGDIVVALIDDNEVTLKHIKHTDKNTITLIPANATLSPISYQAERIKVQGVLVGQLRSYRHK